MEKHQRRSLPYLLEHLSPTGQPSQNPVGRRILLITEILLSAGAKVKPSCRLCGSPFVTEKYGLPDNSSLCPVCRPRESPNLAERCDCGQRSLVVIEISIRSDSDPRLNQREFMPLCLTCALEEIAIRTKRRISNERS